jgi:hypothetical protein
MEGVLETYIFCFYFCLLLLKFYEEFNKQITAMVSDKKDSSVYIHKCDVYLPSTKRKKPLGSLLRTLMENLVSSSRVGSLVALANR